ncbi:MAG: TMEM165/GDT1 family protein [Candidatus Omnitrophica bacterium]|nr:TMEM165/GDT1 family protein [Candidatus Omnitrophota bacterium]
MQAFIGSFIFVLLAEMGDKTQLLAMAFAAKYKARHVLIAVFIATLLNHSLAVLTGHFLTVVVPMRVISFMAAISFIIFGLWTLHGDSLHGEDKRPTHFGPVLTVAIAFFLAEMGDKTQLATVSLAVKYRNMLHVLFGTTFAMVAADAAGILLGVVMRKHIPERGIKWFAASTFIIFGISGIYGSIFEIFSLFYAWSIMALIMALTVYFAYRIARKERIF